MKTKRRKRDTSKLPPLEYRMVFVQFVRRQRSRYNTSLNRFLELPAAFRRDITNRYQAAHPRMNLPEFEVSAPRKSKRKGD